MAFETFNLAEIYGAADRDRANQLRAQMMSGQLQRNALEMEKFQRSEDRRMRLADVYRVNRNSDGGIDMKAALPAVIDIDPEQGYEIQQGMRQQEQEDKKNSAALKWQNLQNRRAMASYLKDIAATVKDQAGYDALLAEGRDLGASFINHAPKEFDPEWLAAQISNADVYIQQHTPKFERVDLGGKTQFIDVNPYTNPEIEGAEFAKTPTVSEQEVMRHNRVTEANAAASLDETKRKNNLQLNSPAAPRTPLSSSAQKELFQADELAQASGSAIGLLTEALKLNKNAYSGWGAKGRAVIGSNLWPGATPNADDTIELDNLITGQALESLKAIFGGMPTEGERQILLDMQASVDKTPQQRETIINRAIEAAQRRMNFNKSKAEALRKGSYFTEGVDLASPATPEAVTEAADQPKASTDPFSVVAPNGVTYTFGSKAAAEEFKRLAGVK